jgi:hypothetical protein
MIDEIKNNKVSFYTQQSQISSPGKFEDLYSELPDSVEDLCQILQKLILHQFWIQDRNNYGVTSNELKKSGRDLNQEINLRTVEDILGFLQALEEQPLTKERKPEKRVVGNCRDFATLLVSILRYQGIPARVRSGVAHYFWQTGFLEDHFICEFWNREENRWQLTDPQIDQVQKDVLGIEMDMTDLPAGQFLNAGESYFDLLSGKIKPKNIGVMDFLGWKYVHYKLISDLASINKMEVLPWEGWGICKRIHKDQLTTSDKSLLEDIAKNLIDLADQNQFEQARDIFLTHPALELPQNYQPYFMKLPIFN